MLIEYLEIKCQLDATDGFFIADLISRSTCFGHHYAYHQELKCIIQMVAACGIWCTKYHRQQLLYNTLELLMMGIMVPEKC